MTPSTRTLVEELEQALAELPMFDVLYETPQTLLGMVGCQP